MTTTKSLIEVKIKDPVKGQVTAVVSSFGVVDRDGDVTSKSTFTDGAPVVVSSYGHTSWDGDLPIGKGSLSTTDGEAIADLQFFMGTPHGKAAFDTIKELGPLQEWSYSLENTVRKAGELDGVSCMFIESTDVKEVSPVLRGASIGTRSLSVKGSKQLSSMVARLLGDAGTQRWGGDRNYVYLDDYDPDESTAVFCVMEYGSGHPRSYVQVDFTRTDTSVSLGETETEVEHTTLYMPKGAKFSEMADVALRGVKSLVETAVERLSFRATEGKSIIEQTTAYDQLLAELVPFKSAIDTATQTPVDEVREALDVEWLRFVRSSQGVTS